MNLYTIFSEDYFYFFESFCQSIEKKQPNSQFFGLGIRRKSINDLMENSSIPVRDYSWLNDQEKKWLQGQYDAEKVDHYRNTLGEEALRDLIICDREFGHGFMSGGLYARTPMRQILEKDSDRRWVYICNMLDYYIEQLSKKSIDKVFMTEITHIWELGLYHACQYLKIPCTVLFYSRFGDVFVVTDNPYNQFSKADLLFKESLKKPDTISAENYKMAQEYIDSFRKQPSLVEYSEFFRKQGLAQAKILHWLKCLGRDLARALFIGLGLKGTKGFLRQRYGLDILVENYRAFRFCRKALKGQFFVHYQARQDRPFIYFPLHFEPEASTMVFAPKFANQLLLIEQIARSMPAGYRLLVKEHIPNTGRRPHHFYHRLTKIPDVELISPFENSFQLIQDAKLVVTITGTAGWESILLKKPTMIFGQTQYNSIGQGFFHSSNLGNITQDLLDAMQTPPVCEERLRSFVAATLQNGFKMPLSHFAYSHYSKDGKSFFAQYDMDTLTTRVLEYV